METWNSRARTRLKEIELTQEWLAEQFDMTPGGMQKWLAGTRQPSLEDINRIAELLRCSPAWLTHGLDENDQVNGLPGNAQSTLRRLISTERANPLPDSFWRAVSAMVQTVAPAALSEDAAGDAETPTSHAAPRNGTHG